MIQCFANSTAGKLQHTKKACEPLIGQQQNPLFYQIIVSVWSTVENVEGPPFNVLPEIARVEMANLSIFGITNALDIALLKQRSYKKIYV